MSTSIVRYNINSTYWKRHYVVSGQNTIYVKNSKITPGKPDLTFHGGDSHDPVIGIVKFRHISADIKIGLHDNNSECLCWKSLSRVERGKFQYSFTHELENGALETFTWDANHQLSFTRAGSMELIHDRTGDVVAIFANYSAVYPPTTEEESEGQVLEVRMDIGESFHLMVLVTCLALYEQMRRRNNSAASGANASTGMGGANPTI
ncbi:uncharacterized protein N7469_007289 [Penicillium citrinum]|uniref:Uncharacterized protein n=2 Tax=Penicillium TaxID=5073 RepID=A0A9W9TLN6_PENCI|nr:uncharacterized protein N7469_007289 [Penicillium citrinum]KAJ5227283.1 hypothetical protein N7469_007289 [Penicillium citrinum]KAJ5568249.1 hypothetical protein N7450_010735 [Penicillium hetheringtonii]KAK5791531.1 hypothetical protein VI817_006840 [Penicillium citrinum]